MLVSNYSLSENLIKSITHNAEHLFTVCKLVLLGNYLARKIMRPFDKS